MGDYLTPYIEFLGLPGSGKSYYSHKVAEKLRGEGYKIAEPSWELDHTCGKYSRAIRKAMMVWLYNFVHHYEVSRINEFLNSFGLSNSDVNRFLRNILYKAYLLNKRNESILFFDEGLAQMAVSLSVKTDKPAEQIYNECLSRLSLKQNALLIRIDCSIETALHNMNQRDSRDSYVEQLSGLDAKNKYLSIYKTGCETIFEHHSLIVTYSQDDSKMVTTIVEFIKSQLNNE